MIVYTRNRSMISIILTVILAANLFIFDVPAVYPAQTPVYQWVYKSESAMMESCIPTSDGGFAFGGYTNILKFNSFGKKEWEMADLSCTHLVQTTDNGYIVIRPTVPPTTDLYGIIVYKIDSYGKKLWEKVVPLYDRSGSLTIRDVKATSNGGFIIACSYPVDSSLTGSYLIKFDSNGKKEWKKDTARDEVEEYISVEQAADGGYIVSAAGSAINAGVGESVQFYLLKINAQGNTEWKKIMPWTGARQFAPKVLQTHDGSYVAAVVYYKNNFNGQSVLNLLKVNSKGDEEWKQNANLKTPFLITAITETKDKGLIILTGWNVAKTDSMGKIEWEKELQGYCTAVNQISDNKYAFAGFWSNRWQYYKCVFVGLSGEQSPAKPITPQEKYARFLNLYDQLLSNLSSFNDRVKKTGKMSVEENKRMDQELTRYLKEIDALNHELQNTTLYNYEDFTNKISQLEVLREQYDTLVEIHINKRLHLPDELEKRFANKDKCTNEDFDGILITKAKGFYSLDLRNVRNYSISEERVDIESKSRKKYFMYVKLINGGQKFPAFSGLGVVKNNVKYVFNTVNYNKRVPGEWINVRDAIAYLMDNNKKTYLKYKDLTVTKGKNNVYAIKIRNVIDKPNQQYIMPGNSWNNTTSYVVDTKSPVKVSYFIDLKDANHVAVYSSKVEMSYKNCRYIFEITK